MNHLPKVALAFSISLLSLAHGAQGQDTYTAPAISDAFAGAGPTGNLSGDNFGAAGSLTVESGALSKGEFQSVIEFDLSGAESSFNAQYGVGDWTIQSVALQLTASPHGNAIFNPVAAGQFGISLMADNTWTEGTGTGGTPTTDGITYDTLESTYINNAVDQNLGSFQFVGGTSGTANYGLGLSSGVLGDITDGGDMSLRLYPNDNDVSYLFNSRMGDPGPELVVTAVPEPDSLALLVTGLAGFSIPCVKRLLNAHLPTR